MALFYKYAKILNEYHTLQEEGRQEEADNLVFPFTKNVSDKERQNIEMAQKQLLIYSTFTERELQKPEYGTDNINSLLFSMGLGTLEQIERYNKALDACIEKYQIGEVIRTEPGEIKAKVDPNLKKKVEKELAPYMDLLSREPLCLMAAPESLMRPKDKLNLMAFTMFEQLVSIGNSGQLIFFPDGSGVVCGINFDNLDVKMSKSLNVYDKRVFEVLSTVAFMHMKNGGIGYPRITLTQIYKGMGYLGKPGKRDLEKIEQSITKMALVWLEIDNINVYVNDEQYGGHKNIAESKIDKKIGAIKYKGNFLQIGFYENPVSIKGAITDKVVEIYTLPKLFEYAVARKMSIITIKTTLLNSPINKNAQSMKIEDYLLMRIGEMKNSQRDKTYHTSNHIKFATLLDACRIDTKNPGRVWDVIKRLLDFYVSENHIKGYEIPKSKDVIEIYLY